MLIPSSLIKGYLSEKFTTFRVQNQEFTTNSIFADDEKKHLSINLETGLWQDFKSKETGNFIHLISHIEGIPYISAEKFIARKLLDSPECLFEVSSVRVENEARVSKVADEFKNFKPLDQKTGYNSDSLTERLAFTCAMGRHLGKFKFSYCEEGKYSNRLIIPYIWDGKPVYFQARRLSSFGMKYLNPSREETGVKSSEILFPFNKKHDYVIVTEGPLDAITLQINGFNATCTQGSMMSKAQARQLKSQSVILSYDNDEAGKEGTAKAYRLLKSLNVKSVCTTSPPAPFKDWNDCFIKQGTKQLTHNVESALTKMDFDYFVKDGLQS
jgi:DNA primase|tara:strand:- start:339 stop:1319 length:981 start_codon:yes stop_codon:yes gene_type:complete